jgi:hypothetical protein
VTAVDKIGSLWPGRVAWSGGLAINCDEGENQIDAPAKFSQVAGAVGSRKNVDLPRHG